MEERKKIKLHLVWFAYMCTNWQYLTFNYVCSWLLAWLWNDVNQGLPPNGSRGPHWNCVPNPLNHNTLRIYLLLWKGNIVSYGLENKRSESVDAHCRSVMMNCRTTTSRPWCSIQARIQFTIWQTPPVELSNVIRHTQMLWRNIIDVYLIRCIHLLWQIQLYTNFSL